MLYIYINAQTQNENHCMMAIATILTQKSQLFFTNIENNHG
ncbi:MAG: hypothetical protein SWX82_17820 [Cyanobacteriota bacterium]|nr:hypothetical protein [Cyanobacteriota bacterium]